MRDRERLLDLGLERDHHGRQLLASYKEAAEPELLLVKAVIERAAGSITRPMVR